MSQGPDSGRELLLDVIDLCPHSEIRGEMDPQDLHMLARHHFTPLMVPKVGFREVGLQLRDKERLGLPTVDPHSLRQRLMNYLLEEVLSPYRPFITDKSAVRVYSVKVQLLQQNIVVNVFVSSNGILRKGGCSHIHRQLIGSIIRVTASANHGHLFTLNDINVEIPHATARTIPTRPYIVMSIDQV